MAAKTSPARVAAQHQLLLHFVGEGHWSDDGVLAKVHEMVCQFDRYPFPQTTSGDMSLRQPLF